jgi:hypothetical protein
MRRRRQKLPKLASETKSPFSLLALRALAFVVACLGLVWAVPNLAASAVSDDFRDLDARLLQFDVLKPSSAIRILRDAESNTLSVCDTHAQRALLLMEMPLAEIALRSGGAKDFDLHLNTIESRSRQVLGCAPRDSLVWLLLFGIEIEHGNLGSHAFDLLEMSYETSPNEGWIGVRRTVVAVPVLLAAPEPVQQMILSEFERLVRNRMVENPARAYSTASAPVRALLQSRIDKLDAKSRKLFSDTLAGFDRL